MWGSKVPNLDRAAFEELLSEIQSTSTDAVGSLMDQVHAALHAGDFETAIDGLLSWNEVVMQIRGGAPGRGLGTGDGSTSDTVGRSSCCRPKTNSRICG